MSVSVGDVWACLIGLLFPYSMFLGFRPPIGLRLDTSTAGRLEKLSYRWLKPLLVLAGTFSAGAAYADRHSDNDLTFWLPLAASLVIWLLTVPAGLHAFRVNYGWDRRYPHLGTLRCRWEPSTPTALGRRQTLPQRPERVER